jgi:two-component system, NarL family, response regulator NreC
VSKPIRILIADDHTIVRSGVRLLLEAEPDIEVVGEALDGNQAVELAASLNPDVILMDIAMPGMDGLEATRLIKTRFPEIQVLVLTMHRSDEYFFEILEAGASGYLLKGADTSDLVKAVRFVHRGEVFLYPTMAQKLLREFFNRSLPGSSYESQLSPREKEILRLVADGYSNKEIAEKLVVSSSTVHSHLSNLMGKLELSSRRELIQYARKHGLLSDF